MIIKPQIISESKKKFGMVYLRQVGGDGGGVEKIFTAKWSFHVSVNQYYSVLKLVCHITTTKKKKKKKKMIMIILNSKLFLY